MLGYDDSDAIPKGVPVQGLRDPDGNPARGRWIIESAASAPRMVMVERFIDEKPEDREWDIWVEQRDGFCDAEKLNTSPIKANTFHEAVYEYLRGADVPIEPIAPDGRERSNSFHVQGGSWHKLSLEDPEDEMGRRLWPTEDQAQGLKIWDVWSEGDGVEGGGQSAMKLNEAHIVADSFDRAVRKHIEVLPADEGSGYSKDEGQNVWLHEGRKLYPTEARARVSTSLRNGVPESTSSSVGPLNSDVNIGDGMSITGAYVTNEQEVGLPPLRMERKAVWDYYRLEFLPNGYPGRRTDGVLMAHPIYGPYVITDYLTQYQRTKNPLFLESACKVADAAVASMEPFQDGLVFMYDEEKAKVSSKKGTWYSGLTQSRYVDVFAKLLTQPGTERFREPLTAVLASLTIPVEKGGVARYTSNGGLIIEEYPALFPNCTLNGWTTATCNIRDLALSTNDDNDWDVFHKSVRGLESIISLYDVPELANSRYKLEGDTTFRLTAGGTGVEVRDVQVVVPNAGTFAANTDGDEGGEALNAGPLNVPEGGFQNIKVRLSRFSWPSPNKLLLKVVAEQEGQLRVAIGETDYNPFGSVPKIKSFRTLQEVTVQAGENSIEVSIPWAAAEMIAHPTNFAKKITNRQFNVYHYIHIDTLTKIVEQTGSEILTYYRDKWAQAPSLWPNHPAYQDERLMMERFDVLKHK